MKNMDKDFCPECGHVFSASSGFCGHCGGSLFLSDELNEDDMLEDDTLIGVYSEDLFPDEPDTIFR